MLPPPQLLPKRLSGQAGLGLAESDTEIVPTTRQRYEPNWLESADAAAATVRDAGGRVLQEPFDIPVGRVAVVADPFDNVLVLLDLSKGRYATDETGRVTDMVAGANSATSPMPVERSWLRAATTLRRWKSRPIPRGRRR